MAKIPEQADSRNELNPRQLSTLLTCIIVMIGSVIPTGYNFTNFNNSMSYMIVWIHDTIVMRYETFLTLAEMNLLWLSIIKIIIIGGIIGTLFTLILNKNFGRKGALITGAILQVCAGTLYIFSRSPDGIIMLYIGRVLIGMATAIIFTTQPMYFLEIVPHKWRGCAGSLTWIGATFGSCLAQLLTLQQVLGTKLYWNYASGLFIVLVLIGLIFVYWLPESPSWIAQRYGEHAVQLSAIEIHDDTFAEPFVGFVEFITNTDFLMDSLIASSYCFCQQFCSVYVVFNYFTNFYEKGALAYSTSISLNLFAVFLNFIGANVSAVILFKVKRRIMLQISIMGCAVTLLALAITLYVMAAYQADAILKPISAVLICVYIIFFNLGLGPIPFFIAAELFDSGPRAVAMNISNFFYWIGQLSACIIYYLLKDSVFCFIPAGIVCLCCFVLTLRHVE